jgi:regulator of nucleoside diphosphate kinase
MKDRIFVTETDFERLRRLVDGRRGGNLSDFEYLDTLEQELDRAEIVEPHAIPRDVITMNSEVRLQDLDSGEEKVYRLVFPGPFRGDNSVSILAPIGTALLGYRTGDVIEWRVPKGIRRLKILEVLYQPEAAGVRQ